MKIKILNDCIYFDIVARSLSHTFRALDIEHEFDSKICPEDEDTDIYILFTTHHIHERLPKHYISYNFEQLTTDKAWSPEFYRRLKAAHQVWDYSRENIRRLNESGITDVVHLPLGYSPAMDSGLKAKTFGKREYDWLMVGAVSPLRADKLQALVHAYSDRHDKYLATNNCWGRDLDRVYQETKVGINLHYYHGDTILEVHRIIPMIANRVLVITEHSSDPWYDEQYKPLVTFLTRGSSNLHRAVLLATESLPEAVIERELDKREKLLKETYSYVTYVSDVKGTLKLS